MKQTCKTCGETKELNIENFDKHPQNRNGYRGSCKDCHKKQRNARKSKYRYYYEITKDDKYQEGYVRAFNKDKAISIMKIRFRGWTINKLCTFKYKHQTFVRGRGGNKRVNSRRD